MRDGIKTLIWDIPTRLFHWSLAGGFLVAAFIALVLGDDSRLFPYHAIIGLIIGLMILMRLIWGVIGSRYARFSSFSFGYSAVKEYTQAILTGENKHYIGHNPAGAWAIFAMLFLLGGLTITGLLLSFGYEFVEDIHEFFANVMVFVVMLHILGVIAHVMRHRENIVASMVHGKKVADVEAGIQSSHFIAALVFCVVCVSWGYGLFSNYDSATQTTTLPVVGLTVQLGEIEGHAKAENNHHDDDD